MASVVSSVIIEDSSQIDGRRYITELHRDRLGGEYRFTYLTEAASDANAIMIARAAQLDDQILREHEDGETEHGLYPE